MFSPNKSLQRTFGPPSFLAYLKKVLPPADSLKLADEQSDTRNKTM